MINKICMNIILEIHAEWLKENGMKEKAKECLRQARLKKGKDFRQIEGYSKSRRIRSGKIFCTDRISC